MLNYLQKPAAIIPTTTTASQPAATNTFQPTSNTFQQQPPVYTPTSVQQQQQQKPLNLTDIEKQQQELDRRAAELDRREQLANTPLGGEKNFPPLPTWCPSPLKPCFFQDINREIPVEFRKWVRLLFYLWICK